MARIYLIPLASEDSFPLKPAGPSGAGKVSELGAILGGARGEETGEISRWGLFFSFDRPQTSFFFFFRSRFSGISHLTRGVKPHPWVREAKAGGDGRRWGACTLFTPNHFSHTSAGINKQIV